MGVILMVCCFAGHNKVYNNESKDKLLMECIKFITQYNVDEFWVGNYGSFDRLSANTVKKLKEVYPSIKLNLIIPYLTREIKHCKSQYYSRFDNIIIADIPKNTPNRLKIIKTNEFMVDYSDFIICYIEHLWGGAAKTLEYAKGKQHIRIINIATVCK